MKLIKLLLGLCCCLILATGCQQQSNKNELKVGVTADYPPFEFKKNGELQGFDVDLVHALAKEMGVTVTFVDMDFNSLIPALNAGKVDVVVSSMSKTPERANNVDFSDIYFEVNFALVVNKDSAITSADDLHDKIVGAQLGTTMEQYAKNIQGAKVVALVENPMLIEELKLGRVDAVITGASQANEFVKANKTLKNIKLGKTGQGYAIAMTKNSLWMNKVQIALHSLKQKNIINELTKKWIEA